jgi:hypothetical protein
LIEKYINKKSKPTAPSDRFVVAGISPDDSAPLDGKAVCGFANLEGLRSFFRDSPQAMASIVIDLKRMVDHLCNCVPTPLLTVASVKKITKQRSLAVAKPSKLGETDTELRSPEALP